MRFADVLRAAVAEIEDYTRATVLTDAEDGLVGAAVTDVIHLLAELIENAATFSPPNTEVRVKAERVGIGFAVEIEDRGLGVKPELLAEANRRLAEPPEYDLVDTDQLGLFVVARLAARHQISVTLQRSPYGGVTAIVLLPHELVVPAEHMAAGMLPMRRRTGRGRACRGVPARHRHRRRDRRPLRDVEPVDAEPVDAEPERAAPVPAEDEPVDAELVDAELVEAPPALPELTGPWGDPGRPVVGVPPRPTPNPWSDDAVPQPVVTV